MCWISEGIHKEVAMAIIILLALILLSGGLTSIVLRRRTAGLQPRAILDSVTAAAPQPRAIPDNIIRVSDWSAALQHRRHRTGRHTTERSADRAPRPAV